MLISLKTIDFEAFCRKIPFIFRLNIAFCPFACVKVEGYVLHFVARFGEFLKRKFEKTDIIRFEFYLAVVGNEVFEDAKEAFAREPALRVARLC